MNLRSSSAAKCASGLCLAATLGLLDCSHYDIDHRCQMWKNAIDVSPDITNHRMGHMVEKTSVTEWQHGRLHWLDLSLRSMWWSKYVHFVYSCIYAIWYDFILSQLPNVWVELICIWCYMTQCGGHMLAT